MDWHSYFTNQRCLRRTPEISQISFRVDAPRRLGYFTCGAKESEVLNVCFLYIRGVHGRCLSFYTQPFVTFAHVNHDPRNPPPNPTRARDQNHDVSCLSCGGTPNHPRKDAPSPSTGLNTRKPHPRPSICRSRHSNDSWFFDF